MFETIPTYETWETIEEIKQGWSKDEKYRITTKDGRHLLLRLSELSTFEKRKKQFALLKEIKRQSIKANEPIAFGECDGKVFMLLTYLEGTDARMAILHLSSFEQYNMGIKAGEILKKLHALPVEDALPSWKERYQNKIFKKIETFQALEIELPEKARVVQYVLDHLDLMKDRPTLFQHGDFHVGNLVIDGEEIGVIDFDKSGFADPYDDFKPFCWNVYASPYFETGLIDGYFGKKVPSDFFPLLAVYAAESMLSHLPWAKSFGKREVRIGIMVYNDLLDWFDHFRQVVPSWYKKP